MKNKSTDRRSVLLSFTNLRNSIELSKAITRVFLQAPCADVKIFVGLQGQYMHDLTLKVYKYCIKEGLLKPGMKVIAGVSGGADSVCLLRMLKEISEEIPLDIICVHIEHGIRGEESRQDMEFVRDLCDRLNVPLKIYEEDIPQKAAELKMSVEEAGRYARYEAFDNEAEANGADAIAVAHHLGDQAETVLFNLSRGSGLKGVSGMSARRGEIIRPLLTISREQIETYLKDIGQDHCTDSTNSDTLYSRNGIRGLVLPELERIVNGAAGHIARAADEIREADDYIRSKALEARSAIVRVESANINHADREDATGNSDPADKGSASPKIFSIDIRSLKSEPPIIRRYIIRSVLTDIYSTLKDLEALHVDEVLGLAGKQSGRNIMLPKGIIAVREGERILIGPGNAVFYREGLADDIRRGIDIDTEGDTLIPDVGVISARIDPIDANEPVPEGLYTKWFDYDKIKNGLRARGRQEGDYLTISDDGQRKKLKKYLIDEKVPGSLRDSLLLIADGEHIVWAVGMRISAHYKITDETKRVLKLTFKDERDISAD